MDYKNIPDYPETVTAGTVLTRLLDGLAFRYYWATEGLTASDVDFKPSDSSMNMLELLHHLNNMAYFVNQSFVKDIDAKANPQTFEELRASTLNYYQQCRIALISMSETDFENVVVGSRKMPFWNLINGPIADALTHVGQITSWRRTNGNPIPSHNPFLGKA